MILNPFIHYAKEPMFNSVLKEWVHSKHFSKLWQLCSSCQDSGFLFFLFSNLPALAFKIWNSAEVFVCTFEKNQILLQNFPWLSSPHSKVLKISFATFQIHHPYWSSTMNRIVTKPTKWHVRPAKTQISLGIHPVWSESSLCTQWVAKDSSFLEADSEDSDRLIWVLAGRTCHFVGFVTMGLKCFFFSHDL